MRIKNLLAMTTTAFLMGLAVAPSAFATQTSIGGTLPADGGTYHYATLRTKATAGAITLRLDNDTSGWTWLWLRNSASATLSEENGWYTPSSSHVAFVKYMSGGSTIYPAGQQFKFSGCMGSGTDTYWSGLLTY